MLHKTINRFVTLAGIGISCMASAGAAEQYASGDRFYSRPAHDLTVESIAFTVGNKVTPSFSLEARGNVLTSEGSTSNAFEPRYVLGLYSKFIAPSESKVAPYFVMGVDGFDNLEQRDAWWYHGDPDSTNAVNLGAGFEYDLGPNLRLNSEVLHQESTSRSSLSIGLNFLF